MARRLRADELAFRQGLAESREKAKSLIMAGRVLLAQTGAPVPKPGHGYPPDTPLALTRGRDFVSRGAHKLVTILDGFNINVERMVCLDAGASTGGFTDCLLQRGAAKVYAVDVGKNQLHEKLRADPRVISQEGVNLRNAPFSLIPEPVDFLCGDLSFISLVHILPTCVKWLKPSSLAAVLIKPQFELGPEKVVKGVVRREEDQLEAVQKIVNFATAELNLTHLGTLPAKIRGPRGNQEYMALFRSPEK